MPSCGSRQISVDGWRRLALAELEEAKAAAKSRAAKKNERRKNKKGGEAAENGVNAAAASLAAASLEDSKVDCAAAKQGDAPHAAAQPAAQPAALHAEASAQPEPSGPDCLAARSLSPAEKLLRQVAPPSYV